MKFLQITCIILVLFLTSCSSTKISSDSLEASPEVMEKPAAPVFSRSGIQGKWELVEFKKDGKIISIVPDTAPNIIGINFGKPDGDLYPVDGFSGVNLFFDSSAIIDDRRNWKKDDNGNLICKDFSIEEFSTTLRTGPWEHLAFEDIFKDCLFNSDKYVLEEDGSLILLGTERNSILTFIKIGENE